MISREKPRVVKLSKAVVNEFVKLEPLKYLERPLNSKRLERLAAAIKEDRYVPFMWFRAYIEESNEIFRLNGQHSSTLLKLHPELIKDDMHVVIWDVTCNTTEEAGELYTGIDSRSSVRSIADEYRAITGADQSLRKTKEIIRRSVISAVSAVENDYNFDANASLTSIERAKLIRDNKKYKAFTLYMDQFGGENWKGFRHMTRGPVFAALYMLYNKVQPRKHLTDFIYLIRDGGGDYDDQTRRLRRWLREHKLQTSGTTGTTEAASKTKRAPTEHFMYRIIETWNRYCTGNDKVIVIRSTTSTNIKRMESRIVKAPRT